MFEGGAFAVYLHKEHGMFELHRETLHDKTIRIVPDPDPMNPRVECDTLGTMICWHPRYNLGDKHSYRDNQELFIALAGYEDEAPFDLEAIEKRSLRNAIILPLYLYDHSGLTMSTTGFSCPWDSGQVGYVFVTLEDARREFSAKCLSSKMRARALDILRAEVDVYDAYLCGEFCGFEIIGDDDDVIDSCWGFSTMDDCLTEARSVLAA